MHLTFFAPRWPCFGGKKQIQARVMQEQQEIFVYDIQRPITSEYLPTIMYLEQVNFATIFAVTRTA